MSSVAEKQLSELMKIRKLLQKLVIYQARSQSHVQDPEKEKDV